MRLKSYFAASVAEAIEKARVELGPEAMLLNSREIAPEQRHLGAFEVVFGITGEPLIPRRSEGITQLFTPPAVTVPQKAAPASFVSTSASVVSSSAPAAAQSAPVVNTIPAWKRTLEELVSRQSAPVTLGSLLQTPKATAEPAVTSAPLPETELAEVFKRETPARPQPKAVPFTPVVPIRSTAAAQISQRLQTASLPTEETPRKSQAELTADLANLQEQIERVKHSLSISQFQSARTPQSRELGALQQQLLGFGFSAGFCGQMLQAIGDRATGFGRSPVSLEQLQKAVVAELHGKLEIEAEIGISGAASKVTMLVGPPGAGKTTTLVKLAIKYGLQRRLPVHLLSLDTVRVGGSEQLATFARILNVGFDALHTTASLAEALGDRRTDEIVLIDCPGYGPADMDDAAATAAFLRRQPDIDVQLVLPAFMSASSLQAAVERFSLFGPSKLLFTHLDEVDSLGPILERAIQSELPISFLTDGQAIPQDLQEAAKDRFTQGILHGAAAFGAA